MAQGLLRQIRARLISGLLVLIPLAITVIALKLILRGLTFFIRPLLQPLLGHVPEYILIFIALVITLALIYLVGLITTNILGRRLIHFGEAILLKLPIVKSIYSASKQVVETFSTSSEAAFQSVVFVDFPYPGVLAIGFITGNTTDNDDHVLCRVFVPNTPNPTSGFLLILPEESVRFTDISIEDGLKMIVSGGVLAPQSFSEALKRTRNVRLDEPLPRDGPPRFS